MNLQTIRENIESKKYETTMEYPKNIRYSEGHVFDEDKSVKWNKEEVVRKNAEIKAKKEAYNQSRAVKFSEFEEDVAAMLIEEYAINDNKAIADKIVSIAYTEGHSGGMYEILNEAMTYADFVEDILKIVKG